MCKVYYQAKRDKTEANLTLNVSISSVEWCFLKRYGRKVDFNRLFSIECIKIHYFGLLRGNWSVINQKYCFYFCVLYDIYYLYFLKSVNDLKQRLINPLPPRKSRSTQLLEFNLPYFRAYNKFNKHVSTWWFREVFLESKANCMYYVYFQFLVQVLFGKLFFIDLSNGNLNNPSTLACLIKVRSQ